MNHSHNELFGHRGLKVWPFVLVLLALAAGVLSLSRTRTSPGALLDLTKTQDEVSILRNKSGEMMMYNFRTVEPGILYRSSGFPRNKKVAEDGEIKKRPAAFQDGQLFEFLRKRNIRTVVNMQQLDYFYAERGYFEWWGKRTGYKIKTVSLAVKDGHAYHKDSSGALRASSKFLELMKNRKKEDGAVLVHCDAGKDRSGVAVAAYELWRNWGKMDNEILWRQVRERYLQSNRAIGADKESSAWAAPLKACSNCGGGKPGDGFVCGEWIDKLRPELELLIQL